MGIGIVTLFGGTGFVGRHLVPRLIERGAAVRVAGRDPAAAALPESVERVRADIIDEAAVAAAVAGAHRVVNLVGILAERGRHTYEAVHVEGARRVAAAAARAGAARLVHFSALGCRPDAPARADRSKAQGEAAVRAAFPAATIVRPSLVFAPDDHFLNRLAAMAGRSPVLPLIGGGTTRFQPVHVDDVAAGVMAILEDETTAGRIYEFGGPEVLTLVQIAERLLAAMRRHRLMLPISFGAAERLGALLELLPEPPFTGDQVRLLMTDKVASGAEPALAALGVTPRGIDTVLPAIREAYR